MADQHEEDVILRLHRYGAHFLRQTEKMARCVSHPRSDMLPFLLEEMEFQKDCAFAFLDENDVILPNKLALKYRVFLGEVIITANRLERLYYNRKIDWNAVRLVRARLRKLKAKFETIKSGFRQVLGLR